MQETKKVLQEIAQMRTRKLGVNVALQRGKQIWVKASEIFLKGVYLWN